MCLNPCFGSYDFKYLFLVLLYLLEMYEIPCLYFFQEYVHVRIMISLNFTFVILSIASQLKPGKFK